MGDGGSGGDPYGSPKGGDEPGWGSGEVGADTNALLTYSGVMTWKKARLLVAQTPLTLGLDPRQHRRIRSIL